MSDMNSFIRTSSKKEKSFFPLYVNENGVGPNILEIKDEFKLSKEKIKSLIKTYSCNDFQIE